ncbi:MAG: COQ9 family protein [Cognatishimia sp.]|nr:COQ9 family protein [Cognatishimia sp.]
MSQDLKSKLVDAALAHVAFDGWSPATFGAAVADSGVDPVVARAICPRGAVDLAVAFHETGDAAMVAALGEADLSEMRFRDKVAFAVRKRLELCPDKEAVRRGSTLFALPHYAPTGTRLIWGTADAIWNALGDTSRDFNWYTKRTTLSGVYAATVLFWLGDESEGHADTWAFLDRRIENVMQFEKAKGAFHKSPLGKALEGPLSSLGRMRAPKTASGFPGRWR